MPVMMRITAARLVPPRARAGVRRPEHRGHAGGCRLLGGRMGGACERLGATGPTSGMPPPTWVTRQPPIGCTGRLASAGGPTPRGRPVGPLPPGLTTDRPRGRQRGPPRRTQARGEGRGEVTPHEGLR